ncbi:MAG: SH3 domain-containing protein [Clostridia bacterium]|nr:SH3 domain-containing protein [Clostridia bacterium]
MNKRILSLVAVVVLLASMFAFVSGASAAGYYAVYSKCPNGDPLNVRSGPGKQYAVIDTVAYGKPIYVVGETYPGWLQLNDIGYVQASLTSRSNPGKYDPSKNPSEKTSLNKIYETAKSVTPYMITLKATAKSKGKANVRWEPMKSALLQKAYSAGQKMLVVAELDKWYQVQDPDTQLVGYVNVAYVEK